MITAAVQDVPIASKERSIVMTTGERGELAERSRLLKSAFDDLTWAAAEFRGEKRAQLVRALTIVADVMGDGDTIADINQMVEGILDRLVEDFGPSAITEVDEPSTTPNGQ